MSRDEARFYLEQAERALHPGWLSLTSSAPDIAAQFYQKAAEEYAQLGTFSEAILIYRKAAEAAATAQAWNTAAACQRALALLVLRHREAMDISSNDLASVFEAAAESSMRADQIDEAFDLLKKGVLALKGAKAKALDDLEATILFLNFEMVRLARKTGSMDRIAESLLFISETALETDRVSNALSAAREVLQLPHCPPAAFKEAALLTVVLALSDGDIVEAQKRLDMAGTLAMPARVELSENHMVGPSPAALNELGLGAQADTEPDMDRIPIYRDPFAQTGTMVLSLLEAYQGGDQAGYDSALARLKESMGLEVFKRAKRIKCPRYLTKTLHSSQEQESLGSGAGDDPDSDDGLR